jgi:hypothetical protein
MFDLNKYAETLLPYPNYIRVLITICIVTVFSIFLFYPKRKVGNIDINSLKISYVEIGENMYQLGIIINVTNLTNKPLSVKNICFLGKKIEMNPRGSLRIPAVDNTVTPLYILNSDICSEIIGDSHLKPSESRKYSTLLPLKQNLIIENGFPFEIVFRGDWKITDTDGQDFIINPRSFGNYEGTFNLSSWSELTDFETVNKLPPTNEYQSDSTVDNYLLYNRDPSAVVSLYGYCNTGYARNEFGTLVFVRGPRTPTLSDGWIILGNNYNDVWSDNEKRQLYNKIVPVDKNTGEPLAFGTFAGIDLGQIKSCPTTRCADVITVSFK